MGEGFRRFKRKIRLNIFIRSILYGISFGLAAVSVAMIINKLVPLGLRWIFYIPIGAGAAAVCWLVSFLILYQSDKKISKRLDRELGLGQKVQTMLEFKGIDGDIVELQREDTDTRLSEIRPKGFVIRKLWICAITLILAIALLAVGIVIPAKQPEPPYDPAYEMSDWQMVALQNLISYVKSSKMTDAAKEDTVDELEALLESLSDATKESQKKTLVVSAITNIRDTVDGYCAYNELGNLMKTSNFDRMVVLETSLRDFVNLPTSASYDELRTGFSQGDNATLSASVSRFSQELSACLRGFSENKSLPLYATLDSLSRGMSTLASEMADYSDDEIQARLDELFDISAEGLFVAMSSEYETEFVGNYAVSELMRIFGITEDDLPADTQDSGSTDSLIESDKDEEDEDKPEAGDDDEELSDGGIGTGELIYGSDDVIYYPNDEAYVKYGEVINEYSAKIYEMLLDGNVSDEMKDYINNYLSMLFDGSKRD